MKELKELLAKVEDPRVLFEDRAVDAAVEQGADETENVEKKAAMPDGCHVP